VSVGVLVADPGGQPVSVLFRGLSFPSASDLIPRRTAATRASRQVPADEAMHHSVVWACLRLRADLISTSPVDCYRNVSSRAVGVPTPQVLETPGGPNVDIVEWLYSTQVDLDRFGNCFGLITARDGLGLPARIDLLSAEKTTVLTKDGQVTGYRHGNQVYDPVDIWHEKQFTVAGLPVGLSPIAAAALTLSTGLSAQEFAADWFAGRAIPAAHLKNTAKVLDPDQAEKVKNRFETSVKAGDVFVTGSDWEYQMLGAKASESGFLEAIHATSADLCRFLGAPGDMVDVNEKTGSVTYANITQRNLQLLIMNLGPAVTRRQRALSRLLARPRYVKLNTDAVVLRMDPASRAALNAVLLESKQRTPSEVREKDDLPPFTPEQIEELKSFDGRELSVAEAIQKVYLGVGKVITSEEARLIVNELGANLPIPGPEFPAQPAPQVTKESA
jgi:HK97 family phage portal protein